ncbi:MAG: hypothetical protein CVU05_05790 [Bacteroidetes bacterium HGW-Bacteroidetes-21]|jgi:hypothetical protein|nr:MAG: hypothetical protein CVU05_05790 [Bacteroidetes bacterium HGW-Bacteroidetes-21]
MKKTIVLLMLAFPFFAQAQFNFEAGYMFSTVKWTSFESFATSYNVVNGIDMEPFKVGNGFHFNVGYDLKVVSFGESYTKYWSNKTVNLTNGDKRNLTMSYSNWTTEVGLGFVGENNFGVFAYAGLGFATVILNTNYEYADGSISYHAGNNLNGVYRAIVSTRPMFAIKAQIPVNESFCVFAKMAYQLKGDLAKDKLTDLNNGRITNDVAWELPTDYNEYINLGQSWSNYYEKHPDDFVKSDISGLSLIVGIKFCINSTRID